MAEWSVLGSDSDEERSLQVSVQLGDLRIPPDRLLHLMRQVENNHTLELTSLMGVHRKRHKKKRRHSKHVHSPAGLRSGEEVSETASEIRSTASTTATDYRESRRVNLRSFDPHYDPELDETAPVTMETKGPRAPPKFNKTKLASLDKILEASSRRQQLVLAAPDPAYHPLTPTSPDTHPGGIEGVNGGLTEMGDMSFGFDDDSDLEEPGSQMDKKISLLSQLNRVEQFLNSDGLT